MSNTTSPQQDAYIPGVCNINTKEIAYRRNVGYVITAIFVVLLAALVLLDVNRFARLILFIPGMLLADCFLQAKNKFCVGYGAAGQHNANEGSEKATTVQDQDAVKKDKTRARQINLQAAAVGLVLTGLSLLIP